MVTEDDRIRLVALMLPGLCKASYQLILNYDLDDPSQKDQLDLYIKQAYRIADRVILEGLNGRKI
jgi:hypothetical protein